MWDFGYAQAYTEVGGHDHNTYISKYAVDLYGAQKNNASLHFVVE